MTPQEFDTDQLAAILGDVVSSYEDAGMSVAVLSGGQVHTASVGLANPELGTEMTDDTLVQIGSTTKMFNAALVVRLSELGLLDLDQPVSEVVGGFALSDPQANKTVTPRHCLSLSSGIDSGQFVDVGFEDDCIARYVETLATEAHLFPPGTGFSYSNAGCVVAGRVAEVAGGKRWDALVREHVLDPAGMHDTETLTDRLLYKRVAVGMSPEGQVIRPWYASRSLGPAGSTAASTASDLIRFARIFLEGGVVDDVRVLTAESVTSMTQPLVESITGFPADWWGLGIGSTRVGENTILGHPGFNVSGCSLVSWVPELGIAVACVTNMPGAYVGMVDCVNRVLERLGCEAPELPRLAPIVDGPTAETHVGVYEAGLVRYEVTMPDGVLTLKVHGKGMLEGFELETALLPAGRHGYLPEKPVQPGFTLPTAIAFSEYGGTPVLILAGAAARKVSA